MSATQKYMYMHVLCNNTEYTHRFARVSHTAAYCTTCEEFTIWCAAERKQKPESAHLLTCAAHYAPQC